jgi:hypothetical protein
MFRRFYFSSNIYLYSTTINKSNAKYGVMSKGADSLLSSIHGLFVDF